MTNRSIPLPTGFAITPLGDNRAEMTVTPLYPGYGMTVGNALRRVLFSSLPGAAVSTVKIKGISHEFSAVPHVAEDIVELIMNLKLLRMKLHGDEPQIVVLKAKGERNVTAKDLDAPTQVEIVNPSQHIATLTDPAATLDLELTLTSGRGYVPVETREKEQREIGTIAVDALYSPVKTVTFRTENVRVEQMTNWDKLILQIETDGTMSPTDAFRMAAQILAEQFHEIGQRMTDDAERAATDGSPAGEENDGQTESEPYDESEAPAAEPKKKRKSSKKKTDDEA
ncbi:MAG: DNA-directed RNA polymerase subunit alpha [Candidatus Kerfeldbacteria bacterium]|nr:DNA-directed RNA polymerase subunit alpha [Candidatus Kerfeldbacteria bacterium]